MSLAHIFWSREGQLTDLSVRLSSAGVLLPQALETIDMDIREEQRAQQVTQVPMSEAEVTQQVTA